MGNTVYRYGTQPPAGEPFDDDDICPDCGAPPFACLCDWYDAHEPDDKANRPDWPRRL